jgi:predicted DNA-binding transcriptional regulator YafY
MANLNELTVAQLKNLAKAAGLSVSGNKAELIERIAGGNGHSHEVELQPTVESIQTREDLLDQMLEAVKISAQAELHYTNRFGKSSRRFIVPLYTYEIFDPETGEVFPYVYAYDSLRKQPIKFCLDRIDSIRWTGKTFTVQPMLYPAVSHLAKQAPRKLEAMNSDIAESLLKSGWSEQPVHLRKTMFVREQNSGTLSW